MRNKIRHGRIGGHRVVIFDSLTERGKVEVRFGPAAEPGRVLAVCDDFLLAKLLDKKPRRGLASKEFLTKAEAWATQEAHDILECEGKADESERNEAGDTDGDYKNADYNRDHTALATKLLAKAKRRRFIPGRRFQP